MHDCDLIRIIIFTLGEDEVEVDPGIVIEGLGVLRGQLGVQDFGAWILDLNLDLG